LLRIQQFVIMPPAVRLMPPPMVALPLARVMPASFPAALRLTHRVIPAPLTVTSAGLPLNPRTVTARDTVTSEESA